MKLFSVPIAVTILGSIGSTAAATIDIRDAWKSHSGGLAEASQPGLGFSFTYDGKFAGPEFSEEWRRTVSEDIKAGITRVNLTHKSGLTVTRETRVLLDFGAVEYKLHFKNNSTKTLAPVSGIKAVDISFGPAVVEGNCVVSSGGGLADEYLPPRSFAIRENCFSPTVADRGVVGLATEGGRSSNKDLPFFFIHNEARKAGMFVAFGWSGQWEAYTAIRYPSETLSVWGKIPDLEIALAPGEEIAGPTVLLGLYQGALSEGSNRLRNLIRDRYTPRLAGAPFLPVATYGHFWNIGTNFDEALLKKLADGAAAVDQEYFLLDAGWYAGAKWFDSVGNWNQVNVERLPNGLKPVADHVRSKGLKFGLWFEPERVAEGSQLAKDHPDWILWDYATERPPWLSSHPFAIDRYENVTPERFKKFGLLDYGRLEVQEWARDLLDRYIRDYGVKYIRYDFNIDPLPYWNARDKPGRKGMTQLRHVQGFYAIIDWIRERHPDVVLEGCASGGRRIDLETARRFHTYLISDSTVDPSVIRFHLFGINYFLPGNYSLVQYTLPSPHQKDFQADDLGFQSLFGGAMGSGGRVDLWPEAMKRKARLHVQTWKKLRRYLVEDYYPLSAQPGDLKSWSGWQFQDPQDRSGFVQTFRTKTPEATQRFFVKGLESQTRYRFEDAYTSVAFELTGAAAMTNGIEVTQEPMSSRVITYRKIAQ